MASSILVISQMKNTFARGHFKLYPNSGIHQVDFRLEKELIVIVWMKLAVLPSDYFLIILSTFKNEV